MNIEVTGAAIARLTRREIASFARKVLLKLHRDAGVSIAFVDDETMTDLNRRFRHRNRTTDVLTFPGDETYSGEIVICVDQARRQAAEEKHSLATEVRYLILHGILHSLGYDHETDGGEMNALEERVREAVGLD
ncbi:MAG TPA: rRNA maturation RNase YbeY [Thermoanaerobaculia bacterium]|nr:rRNA maturation RNase YbeY [Thermoanaerobaculia bacterium]